jgi:hypothetical protein
MLDMFLQSTVVPTVLPWVKPLWAVVVAAAETTQVVLADPAVAAMVDILLRVAQQHPDKATMVAPALVVLQHMQQVAVVVQAL